MELRKAVTFPKSPSDRFPSRTRIQVCLAPESVPLSARHLELASGKGRQGSGVRVGARTTKSVLSLTSSPISLES